MPKRIQRRRTKGWRMPAGAVYVGRPTIFGNPFRIDDALESGYAKTIDDARTIVVQCFREWLLGDSAWLPTAEGDDRRAAIRAHLYELRGKDLVCWCPLDQPCHADVLLEIVNESSGEGEG